MGFYYNVFHILKNCYGDLEGFGRWEDALSPSDIVHICDCYRNGEDAIWEMHLPAYPAEAPGARPPSSEPDVTDWLRRGSPSSSRYSGTTRRIQASHRQLRLSR